MESIKDNRLDWFDNQLYMGHQISHWLRSKGVERLGDISNLTLSELLECESLTIPRLRRIAKLMEDNNLVFKSIA